MKKTTLLLAVMILTVFQSFAQTDQSSEQKSTEVNYNKWSLDFGGGVSKASNPFSDPSIEAGMFSDFMIDLGVRYMFNDKFGLKLDGGFGEISADDESPFDFSTDYARINAQAVLNFGSILNFQSFTQRFNVLGHGGAGVSFFTYPESSLVDNEATVNFMFGITPQIKLSDRFAFYVDLTTIGNFKQDYTIDGQARTVSRDFDGMIVNATAGLSIYLGSNDQHADWVNISKTDQFEEQVNSVENRLAKLESELQDDDRDGVPNYLDLEPNTINGVAVNTKGQAVDKNQNGVPDELEKSLEKRFMSKNEAESAIAKAGLESVKAMANDGAISVYFEFGSTKPETYSYDAINKILLYLRANNTATASLTGYADEIGNAEFNKTLSENRAKRVYDILVASGIEESRLSYQGGGIDSSVNKSSKDARQLVRRVVFEIK
ncbi:MAG: OmpA family protein [Psychroflexus salarius]